MKWVSSFGTPQYGSISSFSAEGDFSYVPPLNFYGDDSFTYDLTNGCSNDQTGTVFITVNPIDDPPANRPP